MRVLEINYTDLPGRIFDGYDLHMVLNKYGWDASMIVMNKRSDSHTVIQVPFDRLENAIIVQLEDRHGIPNMLIPYGAGVKRISRYLQADIVHYHILHNRFISVLDYPDLMERKKAVWTIHDPWAVTGGCIHPLECKKWIEGCHNCNIIRNAEFLYKQKKESFSSLQPTIIVSTEWMKKHIIKSAITRHLRDIRVIPFGVDINDYSLKCKESARTALGLLQNDFVIGFRISDSSIKGCKYLYQALMDLDNRENITLLTVDEGEIPQEIKENFKVITLGWTDEKRRMIDFHLSCDLFVMPSLAESFGLMAVEAMAASSVVICFSGTVLEEIIKAPEIGYAVEYKSPKALREAIIHLMEAPQEREMRGMMGRERVQQMYSFSNYVNRHMELYSEIYLNN